MKKHWIAIGLAVWMVAQILLPAAAFAADSASAGFTDAKRQEIETYFTGLLHSGNVPGAALAIVKGDQVVYERTFGVANAETGQPVKPETLFEMGSATKAFTALALLTLRDEGKLALDDPVTRHLPWFQMSFEGKPATVTLRQLLHHVSGIDLDARAGELPVSSEPGALEATVRMVGQYELKYAPGKTYRYCTANYDVLGLVIQAVSGQSYESFVQERVIKPLGLKHSYIGRPNPSDAVKMATGHKLGYMSSRAYDAPFFGGNTPAAYLYSDIKDMSRWVQIQLKAVSSGIDPRLIDEIHTPNRSVPPISYNNASYAMGWEVYQSGDGEMASQGLNPSFSTYTIFRPGEQWGVVVLTNQGSELVVDMGRGVMKRLIGETYRVQPNQYGGLDKGATVGIALLAPFSLAVLYLIGAAVIELFRGKREWIRFSWQAFAGLIFSLVFMALFLYCMVNLNKVFYMGYSWKTLDIFAPFSILPVVQLAGAAGVLFYLYMLLTAIAPRKDERSYFTLAVLSLASGFGNAIIIFIINEAMTRVTGQSYFYKNGNELILYFVLGLILYAYGQKLIRSRLIEISNRIIYTKRMDLIDKVLKTSYQKLETVERGKIDATLMGDTEMVSRFANAVVTVITGLITVVVCCMYLGFISVPALLVSIVVILISGALYYYISGISGKLWEESRNTQNVFFKLIHDLLGGFKELYLHAGRTQAFRRDVEQSCDTFRVKRKRAETMFANVFVIGELLFVFAIGAVVFLLPIWLPNSFNSSGLSNFVFVFLYMAGPITIILNTIPELVQVRVSWNRIRALSDELTPLSTGERTLPEKQPNQVELTLEAVRFQYLQEGGKPFTVGPIDYTFRSGEVVFITGGNGSGKSTLAKLITGLYEPHGGVITLNGRPMDAEALAQHYSAIFSDVYLFDKLYGIDVSSKQDDIERYLKVLQLDQKIQIVNGEFSTTKLSTGQKKRLALLVSYLEDRPICLFDEWAADQDPEYRHFFYHELLPELKAKGKCVIAISHDDRYFGTADRVIKMEYGTMVSGSDRFALDQSAASLATP